MQILISNHTTKPIYEQITSQIKSAIMSGELKSGDPLPSMRALAKDLHISVIKEFIREEQLRLAEEKLQEAADIGRSNGIPLNTLTQLLAMFYDEK